MCWSGEGRVAGFGRCKFSCTRLVDTYEQMRTQSTLARDMDQAVGVARPEEDENE